MDLPRKRPYGTKPGAYLIASQVFSNVFDPGDVIHFKQYITGYGEILSAKFQCYVSGDIIDSKKSFMTHGLKLGADGKEYWGREETPISPEFYVVFKGKIQDGWPESTVFFDIPDDDRVASETSTQGIPPLSYSFQLRKDIKPGDYKIDFFFTYFNGEKWVCSKEPVAFKVRTYFEKHAVFFAKFGVVCTLISLAMAAMRLFK